MTEDQFQPYASAAHAYLYAHDPEQVRVANEFEAMLCRVAAEAAIEQCAKACERLFFGVDIEELLHMTKKQMSVRACEECAKAIRALSPILPSTDEIAALRSGKPWPTTEEQA